MPIYEETYRSWEGHLERRPRTWWVIAKTGIRLVWKKSMVFLLILGAIPFFVRVVQIYLMTRFGEKADIARALRGFQIDPEFFFQFIQGQNFILLLILILAGAGLIANDRKFNALPIYFSKPVSFWDYIIGKLMVVGFYGSLITLVPGLVLFLVRVMLATDAFFLKQSYWILFALTGYVLLKLVVLGGLVLALSSAAKSSRSAAILFFALLIFPELFRGILSKVPEVGLFSLHTDLKQIGCLLFGLEYPTRFLMWMAWVVLVGATLLAYGILRLKVRPTEVVK